MIKLWCVSKMEFDRIVTLIDHVHVQLYVDPMSHVLGGDEGGGGG